MTNTEIPPANASSLAGQVVLITGSGGGMGRAHALVMAQRGANVVIQDIDERAARETCELIEHIGANAVYQVGDIARLECIEEFVDLALEEFNRIDVLVNNAGIGGFEELEDITEDMFDRVIAVDLKATFFCGQAVAPYMKQQRQGKIINISSRWGVVGNENGSDYCAAKAGVLGLTKAWARELAPFNINVNAIAPGGVWSDMAIEELGSIEGVREAERKVPLGRWCQPEEISYLVSFLASAESDFLTGQVFNPNGGMSIV